MDKNIPGTYRKLDRLPMKPSTVQEGNTAGGTENNTRVRVALSVPCVRAESNVIGA